jgi:hypothetical protein
MASLDELISQLQQVNDKIDEAVSQAGSAEDEAGELQSQFAGMGAEAQASVVASIKDGIESWRNQLHGAKDSGNQLIEQVKAVKGG